MYLRALQGHIRDFTALRLHPNCVKSRWRTVLSAPCSASPDYEDTGRTPGTVARSLAPKRYVSTWQEDHPNWVYLSHDGQYQDKDMTDLDINELGPVDYLVVEFPPETSNFTGEMASEIARLVDAKIVRVLDLLILRKDEDGTVEGLEIDDFQALDELRAAEAQLAELLAEEDVAHLAAAMEPGTTAGVLVWENSWAAPFASAARRAGGQLIASGRIPIQAILASLEAEVPTEGE